MTTIEAACDLAARYAKPRDLRFAVVQETDFVRIIFWNGRHYMTTPLLMARSNWPAASKEIMQELDRHWAAMAV